jgi:two-component system alkaline phosphatase synthesis response regulator PhoP
MKKICLVEDENSIAELVVMNLELEGFKVEVFHHGSEALINLHTLCQADLVILDVMLPEVSGLELCSRIRSHSQVPILFLSAKGTTEDKIIGLKLGGNDYLSKPFDLEELLLRIRVLTQSRTDTLNEIQESIKIGSFSVDFNTYEVQSINGEYVSTLSKREIELLRMFAEQQGKVISRDDILDRVWGTDQYPTSRTIDNYILNFRKLFEEFPKSPRHFHSVRAVGYKFTP